MFTRIAFAFFVASLAAAAAQAQTWPSKPVRYVVPFPPAGATDILARIMAERISGPLGQPIVVENRPGAAGNVGTEMVARAPADGYTILQATAAQAISETLYTKRSFSFEHDLAATAMIARMPNVMVVNPSVPAKSVAEFIALAKSKPGKLNFAASGSGTSLHMAGEMFKMMTGVDIVFVPYKGSGPALADLMGGQVDLMFDNLTAAIGHIRSGKLRALAVTTSTRHPELPDLPTMQEAGVPGYEVTAWQALFVPAKTPPEIIRRISVDTNTALAGPAIKDKLAQTGYLAGGSSPEELEKLLKSEISKWSAVIKTVGIKID